MNIDLEALSDRSKRNASQFWFACVPYVRRFLRFLALPYCFSKVNWKECTKTKTQVALTFFIYFSD